MFSMIFCLLSCILYAAYMQMGANGCKFMLHCTSIDLIPYQNYSMVLLGLLYFHVVLYFFIFSNYYHIIRNFV